LHNRERIKRASRRLRLIVQVIIIFLPVFNALFWFFINDFPETMSRNMLPHYVRLPLPVLGCILGFAVSMLPVGVSMAGGQYLVRLFRLYEQGDIFKLANVLCFKRLSRVLIWWFVAGIVYRSLLSVVLTLHHPPGQRMIAVGLGSPDLTALLLGGILAVVAWVMEEGRKIQEEQELTV
jgi:hypothetical protein